MRLHVPPMILENLPCYCLPAEPVLISSCPGPVEPIPSCPWYAMGQHSRSIEVADPTRRWCPQPLYRLFERINPKPTQNSPHLPSWGNTAHGWVESVGPECLCLLRTKSGARARQDYHYSAAIRRREQQSLCCSGCRTRRDFCIHLRRDQREDA